MKTDRMITAALITLLAALYSFTAAADDNWPQFRGPGARGISDNNDLPDRWSATENVAWKTDIPGRGWSCPIVWGDRVFITTSMGPAKTEPMKGGYESKGPSELGNERKVLCLDLSSGKILWDRIVHAGKPANTIHEKNSYASETPVTDGQRVYAYFGNIGVFCLDFEGNAVWSEALKPHETRHGWGTASSPALYKDRLYIVNDNEEESYLLALDKNTGKEIWRTIRDEKSNWATPYIWENQQRTEIITPGTDKTRSYDLDGKLLWWFTGMTGVTIATPYSDRGLLYISSGFMRDKIQPIYAISPGAWDDISLKEHETGGEFIVWRALKGGPYNPTTLLYDGRLYSLQDSGRFSAFDSMTGKPFYENEKLPPGQRFTASPWAYNGKIFCLSENGVTFVLRAGDKFELLDTNKLADDDAMTLATPALTKDRLLIRTAGKVYCIQKGK